MILPLLMGAIVSLITGNPDFVVIIGVLLLLGTALDVVVYNFVIKWQPPWMTGVIAILEFGLLLVLASQLDLDLTFVESLILYIVAFGLFEFTKVVLLPIVSLTYVESAGEFRRAAWSIPPSKELLPILAASESDPLKRGKLISEASGAHAIPLSKQPGLSGTHARPPAVGR
jgi:hypothetical protein